MRPPAAVLGTSSAAFCWIGHCLHFVCRPSYSRPQRCLKIFHISQLIFVGLSEPTRQPYRVIITSYTKTAYNVFQSEFLRPSSMSYHCLGLTVSLVQERRKANRGSSASEVWPGPKASRIREKGEGKGKASKGSTQPERRNSGLYHRRVMCTVDHANLGSSGAAAVPARAWGSDDIV